MVADRAFEHNNDGYVFTSKTKLHQLTYQQVREVTNGLNADLVCAARNYAADSVKGVISAWQNGKYATQPTFTANTVVYNKNVVTYRDDHCTLSPVNGYVKAEYVLPPEGENPQTSGSLQQTGTEAAHRTIDGIGERESRWAEDYLHRISKALVQEAMTHDCATIAFEDLTDIRDRMPDAKASHAWAFRRLHEYIEYKATEVGILTKQVNPAYTFQRCSKCGHTERGNRPKQERFCCRKCGYEVYADYNAAKNIGIKHVHAGQKSPRGRANRQLAQKSGTVSVSNEFASAEGSA
jgi:IS605 OrfB family transposase